MKNKIVTCIKNHHQLYNDSFKREHIKVGASYKCIDELKLTVPEYYIPEFASLSGITIRAQIGKWGWERPCLPKECFRLATPNEIIRYKLLFILKFLPRLIKTIWFKIIHAADRIIRRKYYDRLNKFYDDYYS